MIASAAARTTTMPRRNRSEFGRNESINDDGSVGSANTSESSSVKPVGAASKNATSTLILLVMMGAAYIVCFLTSSATMRTLLKETNGEGIIGADGSGSRINGGLTINSRGLQSSFDPPQADNIMMTEEDDVQRPKYYSTPYGTDDRDISSINTPAPVNIDVDVNYQTTVIALISMGIKTTSTFLAERCIQSIRRGGNFKGYILLLTDSHGYQKYTKPQSNSSFFIDPKVLIVQGRPEDMNPTRVKIIDERRNSLSTSTSTSTPIVAEEIEYPVESMKIQRFKTLLPKYVALHPSLNKQIHYIMYLDVDNVVTQDLRPLFEDYYQQSFRRWYDDHHHHQQQQEQHQSGRRLQKQAEREKQQRQQQQTLRQRRFDIPHRLATDQEMNIAAQSHHQRYLAEQKNDGQQSIVDVTNSLHLEKQQQRQQQQQQQQHQSLISFWKDVTKGKNARWQGGQFILHRYYGSHCLDVWRDGFDKGIERKDQPLLMEIANDPSKYNCVINELPTSTVVSRTSPLSIIHRKHFNMLSRDVVSPDAPLQIFPTIVHISGFRTRMYSGQQQIRFLRKALRLQDEIPPAQQQSWEDTILSPVGPKGQLPVQPGDGELFTRPTENNTAIALVAMGTAPETYLTERCIKSIRTRGEFDGPILVITNQKGIERYNDTLSFEENVYLIQAKQEDMVPRRRLGNGKRMKIKYSKFTMIYKRFKSLIFKYLDLADLRFSASTKYALYLDIDNVVANRLDNFFEDYYTKVNRELKMAGVSSLNDHGYISLWKEPSKNGDHFQGGQFMIHREHGRKCGDAWRHEMDTVPSTRDQPLLMNVVEKVDRYQCIVSLLPNQNTSHFNMLQPDIIRSEPEKYPTIVHISGLRTQMFSEEDQRYFLRNALRLEDPQEDTDSGNESVRKQKFAIGSIDSEDIIEPVGLKFQRPKRKSRQYLPLVIEATS